MRTAAVVLSLFLASCAVNHSTPEQVAAACTSEWKSFDRDLSVSTIPYRVWTRRGGLFGSDAYLRVSVHADHWSANEAAGLKPAALYSLRLHRDASHWNWIRSEPSVTLPSGQNIRSENVGSLVGHGGRCIEWASLRGFSRAEFERFSREPLTFQMRGDCPETLELSPIVFAGLLQAFDAECGKHQLDPRLEPNGAGRIRKE